MKFGLLLKVKVSIVDEERILLILSGGKKNENYEKEECRKRNS